MFDRDQYMKYVGSKSGNSYASGLVRIEKIYDVSIDEDYQSDQCSNLLAQLEADKINPALDAKEQKQRSDMTSHLKKYIEFMQNSTATHQNHADNPNEQPLSAPVYWPSLDEYNPKLSKYDWKKYLLEIEMPDHSSPMQMLKAMMELGGEATCKKLVECYGGDPGRYVDCSVNLGKRAKKFFHLSPCMDGDQERFFAIPFLGRYIKEDGSKNYSYLIRPELLEALKEIDLSGANVYASEEKPSKENSMTDISLNTILYGLPGTGKTYYRTLCRRDHREQNTRCH